MVIGPLVNLAGSFIESLIPGHSNGSSSTGKSTQDANGTSPFAQVLSSVQQSKSTSGRLP